jgi:hypothetical protein
MPPNKIHIKPLVEKLSISGFIAIIISQPIRTYAIVEILSYLPV